MLQVILQEHRAKKTRKRRGMFYIVADPALIQMMPGSRIQTNTVPENCTFVSEVLYRIPLSYWKFQSFDSKMLNHLTFLGFPSYEASKLLTPAIVKISYNKR